ncbi:MAG: hypothetical protein AAFZ49_17565, partial [Cyanobacteria bacterium J06659_2]
QVNATAVLDELKVYGDRHPECDAMIFDARNTADLIWPLSLFRPALDTEVIYLLAMLPISSGIVNVPPEKHKAARRILNQFLRTVWLANKERFPVSEVQHPS